MQYKKNMQMLESELWYNNWKGLKIQPCRRFSAGETVQASLVCDLWPY